MMNNITALITLIFTDFNKFNISFETAGVGADNTASRVLWLDHDGKNH